MLGSLALLAGLRLSKKIHDSSFCNPITLTSNLSAYRATQPKNISLSENNFSCFLKRGAAQFLLMFPCH